MHEILTRPCLLCAFTLPAWPDSIVSLFPALPLVGWLGVWTGLSRLEQFTLKQELICMVAVWWVVCPLLYMWQWSLSSADGWAGWMLLDTPQCHTILRLAALHTSQALSALHTARRTQDFPYHYLRLTSHSNCYYRHRIAQVTDKLHCMLFVLYVAIERVLKLCCIVFNGGLSHFRCGKKGANDTSAGIDSCLTLSHLYITCSSTKPP